MSKPLRIKVFADGANLEEILAAYRSGTVSGFTTNPTLMAKAGIKDYEVFARTVLSYVKDLPISFEVFSDEFAEMDRQAKKLAGLGDNVYVKIPITNTRGESAVPLVQSLSQQGVKLNVTAILTLEQVRAVAGALDKGVAAVVSVFAGRIADTGHDPMPIMRESLEILRPLPMAQLLWASPREVLNVVQADEIGCHIITMTADIRKKLPLLGTGLAEMSLDTVKMFYSDARAAGYEL